MRRLRTAQSNLFSQTRRAHTVPDSGSITAVARKSNTLAPLPSPMAAKAAAKLPSGPDWIYEVKWDGYRVLAVKEGRHVRLFSRKGNELTDDFPSVVAAVARIKAASALIDGEVVALDPRGRPSFHMLQHRASGKPAAIVYYAFDLLRVGARGLCEQPLSYRKERLQALVTGTGVNFSASLEGSTDRIVTQIKKLRLEGLVAKRKDSRYRAGERSGAWVKVKFSPAQEFVVGGFRCGNPLESLVVGYHEGPKLLCAGRVRQGLDPGRRRELYTLLRPLWTEVCPFTNLPNSKASHWGEGITADQMNEIQWVAPRVVAQVSFVEWTLGGALRHATFEGIRHDKSAAEVVREP